MHELSFIADLIRKVESLAGEHPGRSVLEVTLSLGALSPLSESGLRDGFSLAAPGTVAQGAKLTIEVLSDPSAPRAQDVLLRTIKFGDCP